MHQSRTLADGAAGGSHPACLQAEVHVGEAEEAADRQARHDGPQRELVGILAAPRRRAVGFTIFHAAACTRQLGVGCSSEVGFEWNQLEKQRAGALATCC